MADAPITRPDENWKPVPGFEEQYFVSDLGRVWSVRAGRCLALRANDYQSVGLPGGLTRKVHHLVLDAFVGTRPAGHECGHLDGDPANNRLSNLAWITPKENALHQEKHGTRVRSQTHPQAKLTDADVLEIRRRRSAGEKWDAIAADYPVTTGTLITAGLGRTFWHLDPSTIPPSNPRRRKPHQKRRPAKPRQHGYVRPDLLERGG